MPEVNDQVYVDSKSVACDGGVGPLGHPRVFLAMDRSDRVECPYCSRRFIYRPGGGGADGVAASRAPAERATPS